jgi:hypothetical protein
MTKWPKQSKCDSFYGNPRGANDEASASWEANNLVRIEPPYQLFYDGQPIKSIRVHKKCADAFMHVFGAIKTAVNGDPARLAECGASAFGGSYNYRLMRGGHRLSMHSYGCAIDLDPARNGFHDTSPHFLRYPFVIKAFEDAGATWGGRWSGRSCDGMHFQFASV